MVLTGAMALAQFPLVEARHGYQPFHMSRGVSIFTHSGFPVPKGAPWKEEFDANLGRTMERSPYVIAESPFHFLACEYFDFQELKNGHAST